MICASRLADTIPLPGREPMPSRTLPTRLCVKRLQTGKAAPAALRFSRWSIRRRGRSAAEAAASASRSAGAALRSPDPFYAVIPAIARTHSSLFSYSNYTIKPQKTQCFLRFSAYFLSFIGTMDLLRRYWNSRCVISTLSPFGASGHG